MSLAPYLGVSASLGANKWMVAPVEEADIAALGHPDLPPLASRILASRGIKPDDLPLILTPRLRDHMPDPLVLLGMDRAVAAILAAVKAGEKITILADYDVDGATSGAILLAWLNHIEANVGVFVPDRLKDGYGPNPHLMAKMAADGTGLVITVDCGAAAYEALEKAAELGLKVVVFDHHLMGENGPPATALVNPNNPHDNSGLGAMTAAGVAFMAAVALDRQARQEGLTKGYDLMSLLDLAALGTVCDVAPLTGFNRVLVAQGLKILGKLARPGLAALAKEGAIKKPDSISAVGFGFGPRLNAGGRIGDSATAVRLLASLEKAEVDQLAAQLDALNQERRAIEQTVSDEAMAIIAAEGLAERPVIVVGKENWHPGVVGIVAGRLKDKYYRPVLVAGSAPAYDEDGVPLPTLAKGSGRSIDGANLGRAIGLAVHEDILKTGGGHAMAAGFSCGFDQLAPLQSALEKYLAADVEVATSAKQLTIDAPISLGGATRSLVDGLSILEPFGTSWPEPIFVAKNVRPMFASVVGAGHIRVTLEDENRGRLKAICFRAVGTSLGDALMGNGALHVAFKLSADDYGGGKGVSCQIVDAAPIA